MPNIRQFIEYDEPEGTIYKTAQCVLTVMMQVIGPFPQTKQVDLKNFEKQAFFPVKKRIRLFFLILQSLADLKEQTILVHEEVRHLLCN